MTLVIRSVGNTNWYEVLAKFRPATLVTMSPWLSELLSARGTAMGVAVEGSQACLANQAGQ